MHNLSRSDSNQPLSPTNYRSVHTFSAATLTDLLARGTAATQVPARLEIYYNCRRERVDSIQTFSRSLGQSRPGKNVEPLMPYQEYNQIVFRHDAWSHAEQALAYEESIVRWVKLKFIAALSACEKRGGDRGCGHSREMTMRRQPGRSSTSTTWI